MTEYEMVDASVQWLSDHGFRVATEVMCLSRAVDVVYMDGGDIVTVEFKLKNWRRAITQARDHALSADRAYICLPRTHAAMAMEAAKYGVGVMEWSEAGAIRVVSEPPPDRMPPFTGTRTWLLNDFERRAIEHTPAPQEGE